MINIQSRTLKNLPLKIVGGTSYGRFGKISAEQTINMIISDKWLVPFAGHTLIAAIVPNGEGRAIYYSERFKHFVVVIDNGVYIIDNNNGVAKIATIATFSGLVDIEENNATQIGICDQRNIYMFNYVTNSFSIADINFRPGSLRYQDTVFISNDLDAPKWRLSDFSNGLSWPDDAPHVGLFQGKGGDLPVSTVPVPSKGNALWVMGSKSTEIWFNLGYDLFPYQRSTFSDIDYGCLNPATIAFMDNFVVWLAGNENSGPVIMYSQGSEPQALPGSEGINYRLAQLNDPSNSYGFLFRQDGHLIYFITFADPSDDLTLIFDFETKTFFTLTDHNGNAHIAKRIACAGNRYFFISNIDGNVYEMNSKYTTYDGHEIARIRICPPTRLPDQSRFSINSLSFTMQQGEDHELAKVYLSFSKDGGQTWSNSNHIDLNPYGQRRNRIIFRNLGFANDFVPQLRFYSLDRAIATDGILSIYQ